MRKYLAIPILLFYTLSMCGIMVYAHYCCAASVTVSLSPKGEDCNGCSSCGKTTRNCCEDKVITFQTAQDQDQVSPFRLKQVIDEIVLPAPVVFAPEKVILTVTNKTPQYMPNAPPGLWQNIPLYKLLSSLTYYG